MSATATLPLSTPVQETGFPPESKPLRRQIPSQRNREIFEAVLLGKSHAQAAAEFGITQPRVTQIVQQVRDWMSQVNRGEEYGYTEIQMLRLAEETLRIQLDGWMRMAMGEWQKSCKENCGRTAFLGQAGRFAMNLARLAGVDVTGKTARAKAEQQAREEGLERQQRAEIPLWTNEPNLQAAAAPPPVAAAAKAIPADVCDQSPVAAATMEERETSEKNSYGKSGAGQTVAVPCDKSIPKFLDKKVRQRLLALRRDLARSATLAAVG